MIPIPAAPIREENGDIVFDISSDELNDDWLRSSRLSKEEREEKERPLYKYVEGEDKENAVT